MVDAPAERRRAPLRSWPSRLRRLAVCALVFAQTLGVLSTKAAFAQGSAELVALENRTATFNWDPTRQGVYANFEFQDAVDDELIQKLRRGLPTRILMTALVFASGSSEPISTTYQSCKVTWHVWEDMYRVELVRPNQPQGAGHWTPTLNGVLRRCATATQLLVADASQLAGAPGLRLEVRVRINPVSEETLSKLKRWLSHPSRTGTATPGSALFSTFTGLFLQRMGDAEKTLGFATFEASIR